MEIPFISKRQCNRFLKVLPDPGNAEKISVRTVISCAIWVIKNGLSWNQIPEKYGKADTIRKRFSRWSKAGVFRKVFQNIASNAGKSNIAMIDSTTIKAHRTAASMSFDGYPREIGRSAGGLTTKIHLLANIEKMPLDFILSAGQVNDAKIGKDIVGNNRGKIKILLADRAYDTNAIRKSLESVGADACIPTKSNRINPAPHDLELYKKRSIIDNMFSRLKDWRGIAMRFCRNAHIFDSFVCLALITIFADVR